MIVFNPLKGAKTIILITMTQIYVPPSYKNSKNKPINNY